jgi:translation initiation factor IF-2
MMQRPGKPNPPQPDKPAAKPLPIVPEPPVKEPEEPTGPTMTMQGVSGKKITGVVKVVKVIRPKPAETDTPAAPPAAAQTEPAPVQTAAPVAQTVPVPVPSVSAPVAPPVVVKAEAEPVLVAAEPAVPVAPIAKPEVAAPAAPASVAVAAPQTPAPVTEPAGQIIAEAEAPAKSTGAGSEQPAVPAAAQSSRGPGQGPGGYAARPQGDRGPGQGEGPGGYTGRPQGDRGPGQGQGGYAARPQGDRGPGQGQGGYAARPQGDRGPGQGPGGYAARPQGDRGPGQGQGGYAARPQGDRGPGQGPGGYAARPQGDRGPGQGPGGYAGRPQGDRGPGQGPGGYAGRPQGDRGPGPGGYAARPQGDRGPGQGPGGYAGRPQGDRGPSQSGFGYRSPGSGFGGGGFAKDKDADNDRGPGGRPQGARNSPRSGPAGRSGKPPIPGASDELGGKAAEPRTNFAARDAFEKVVKRDDKKDNRDTKKDATKGAIDTKDKHQMLKQQAQVLSGKPVGAALADENILDTLYKEPAKPVRGRTVRSPRRGQRQAAPVVRAVLTHVKLPPVLTVKEFSEAIKKTSADVIKRLIKLGLMATLNQEIDFDTAALIAGEFGITAEKLVLLTEEDILFDDTEDDEAVLVDRPPVVVVMGHVDHGKTSILDRIRSSSVASGEAGGITQHIGAYTVKAKNRQITFLDTPGHAAFTTMRARGAQVTDIAILVVAADDGVMPQTLEAINHARAADTQIVVAINKIDLPGANIDRVKQELSTHELVPEEWGGSTVMVPVSAKTGEGLDDLLEMVLLTADLMDLRTNPNKQAKGTVIEAKLDKNRGPVATVLVQRGTLSIGDTLVTGSIFGHIRAMVDDKGNSVRKAGPSIPVEVLGLPEVPEAGELFYAVTDEKVARALAERRRVVQREQQLRSSSRMSLDTLFSQMAAGEVKDLNIIVKADVQGSVEAVRQSLAKLTTAEVRVNVIHGAVGAITESDIRLAEVSNAIVIGFNVRPAVNVADMAKEIGVDIRMYRIIYNAIEDIEAAMKGMLSPKFREGVLGHAQVRQVFRVSGIGSIGGCFVTDGRIVRSSEIRVVRDGIVIHEGKIASLKRFKDDAREVAAGFECGIGIERFNDIKENDVIEAYEMQVIERS